MTIYRGSCHCGQVQFTVDTIIDKVIACNCSICSKKGVLHHRVAPEQFNLVDGEELLSLYQFGTRKANHYFCTMCGIHAFSNPRSAPEMYSVNVRCLDNFDLGAASYELIHFDGRNWEQAVNSLNENFR
jgi:hypothetical protein